MFILEYIKNPRYIGAVAPSSKHLANKMISEIDFEKAKYIIEYGPGTGAFTEKILSRVNNDTIVILIEINKEFYNTLKKLYGYKKNVIILNDSVENIDSILKKYSISEVDYIVSGLPFGSLPQNVSKCILKKTSDILKYKGKFITFQYSLFKLNFINKFFNKVSYSKVLVNFPPAYVLTCEGDNYEQKHISGWWW